MRWTVSICVWPESLCAVCGTEGKDLIWLVRWQVWQHVQPGGSELEKLGLAVEALSRSCGSRLEAARTTRYCCLLPFHLKSIFYSVWMYSVISPPLISTEVASWGDRFKDGNSTRSFLKGISWISRHLNVFHTFQCRTSKIQTDVKRKINSFF